MYKFGKRSLKFIDELHPDLQDVLLTAIQDAPRDFCVICGHRGEKAQNAAYDAKNSTLRFPNSNHNSMPATAFDFAPYERTNPHIRWEDIEAFSQVAEHILETANDLGIDIVLGKDWVNFPDYPHVELA